ncbi:MAG: hypothetical protein H6739_39550 [Alphaproteobacteria bacterium]|nr:hypothetical protein [Alphaproteobacteria bacterium]
MRSAGPSADVLQAWLRPELLDPRALQEQARARPFERYLVVDDLLRPEALEALQAAWATLPLVPDSPDLNYDALAMRLDGDPASPGHELWTSPAWHDWVARALDITLRQPGRTVVKARRHPPDSLGFWPHTDRDPEACKSAAALLYLTPDWRAADGGLLQLWEVETLDPAPAGLLRWDAFVGRPLGFLEEATTLEVEVAAPVGVRPARARLLAQVVPQANRLVLLDFQRGPAYHSITPNRRRSRQGVVQWLY